MERKDFLPLHVEGKHFKGDRPPRGWNLKIKKLALCRVGCDLLELRGSKDLVIVRGFWIHGGCSGREWVKADEFWGGLRADAGMVDQTEKLAHSKGSKETLETILAEVAGAVKWQRRLLWSGGRGRRQWWWRIQGHTVAIPSSSLFFLTLLLYSLLYVFFFFKFGCSFD